MIVLSSKCKKPHRRLHMRKLLFYTSILMLSTHSLSAICEDLPDLKFDWEDIIDPNEIETPTDQLVPVIEAKDLTEDVIAQFCAGELTNVIIAFPAGTIIPLQVILSGNLLALGNIDDAVPYFEMLQTIYVRHDGSNFIFSQDLQNWKQIADFLTGNISAVFGMQDSYPSFTLTVDVNTQ